MAEETKTTPEEKAEPMEQADEKEAIKENGSTEDEKDEKEETEENGDEESDGESSEEELGLLERPVEILDRKRERKSTERLALEKYTAPKTPKDELDFETGRGKKLGDIPYVKHMIDKTLSEELKPMHRLLFFKQQKATMVKKSIRSFCGYPFDKESNFYEKAEGVMDRLVMSALKLILNVLGLDKNGDKTAVKERILEFLMEPKDLEKPIPGKKPKAAKKTPKKKKKKTSTSKKSSKKEKKDGKSADEVSSASESEDENEEGEKEDGEKSEEKEKKKKSPKKKPAEKKEKSKKTEKKKSKQPTIKLPTPKKKKAASSPKKRKADDSDDDDQPLVKKTKQEPSDADLKKVVSSILKDADLEQITMKTVVKQVYDKYPKVDLTPRKDFIKNTVKEIIS